VTATSLESSLVQATPRLTERVLAEMYANPFWHERFGARGRVHAERDGGSHIEYLVEALVAGDSRVFENYATWLRSVLVSRGMCTRHLVDNFNRLAAAINDETWPERARAVAFLHAGAAVLIHQSSDAGSIDAERGSLASDAVISMVAAHPDWFARLGRARCVDDLDYHLSFLADALAFAQPDRFVEYVVFIAKFLARRGVAVAHLTESLVTMSVVIRSRCPAISARPFELLDTARTAIDATPSAL
jgi:hypothetical protein